MRVCVFFLLNENKTNKKYSMHEEMFPFDDALPKSDADSNLLHSHLDP